MAVGCGDTRRNNGTSTTVHGIRYGTLEEGGREEGREGGREGGREKGEMRGVGGRSDGGQTGRQAGRQADLVEVLRREGQVEHGWKAVHTVGSHGCLPAPSDVAKVIVGTVVVIEEGNWRSKE